MAKIMLVDDAAFMRMMIKKALTQSGYSDFVEAQDGAEAVKKYGEAEAGYGNHGYHDAEHGRPAGFKEDKGK